MNANTGKVYPSVDDAVRAGEALADLIEITGTADQVRKVSAAVKQTNKARRKRQRASRRANRRP